MVVNDIAAKGVGGAPRGDGATECNDDDDSIREDNTSAGIRFTFERSKLSGAVEVEGELVT